MFDFNFAVNRTLVFGVVSFILLASFGLTEKAVEELLPEAWQKGSALFSAGIALALFLSFHRLRDWIEVRIERLFFRQWHDNEANLRTFVANAGHFERRQALIEAATRQFHRFTQTSAALFWRDAQGDYRLECASPAWPLASIDADDPALTEARARREVVYPVAVGSTLTAELMLPVSDHGQVIALILIAPKPNGIGYRPDEVEVLGWAAQQVGIDLQSMRSPDLQGEVGELRLRLGVLAELLGPRQLLPAAIG